MFRLPSILLFGLFHLAESVLYFRPSHLRRQKVDQQVKEWRAQFGS